tara:strand:+ start:276 stop:1028 length:753 start_codon:yes stop_codon:yes gene_type:complete
MKIFLLLFILFSTSLNALSINFDFEDLGTIFIDLDESVLAQSTVSRTQIEVFETEQNLNNYATGSIGSQNYDSFDSHLYNFLSFPGYEEDWSFPGSQDYVSMNLIDELTANLNIPTFNNLDLSNFDTRNDNSNVSFSPTYGGPVFVPGHIFINQDYTIMFDNSMYHAADINFYMQDGKELLIDFEAFPNDGFVNGGSSLAASIWFIDNNGEGSTTLIDSDIVTISTLVPEPSTYALIFGAVGLGFAVSRR